MTHRPKLALRLRAWIALTVWLAAAPALAQENITDVLRRAWGHAVQAAEAQDAYEVVDDEDTPAANAVVRVGGCTGALITPSLVLTAAHCVPKEPGTTEPHPACGLLPMQAELAQFAQHDPYEWRDFPRAGRPVRVTARRDSYKMQVGSVAVSQPRCADMALLRLARPIPASVATPLPVMSTPPLNENRFYGSARMRFSGWGVPKSLRREVPHRQTGSVRFWGVNTCFVATLPPLRRNGQRIISGDSGAPLLVRRGPREVVAGILWGKGAADHQTCGLIAPSPPELHGLYTPTYRPQILGTGSTDIGDWLRQMAPEAEHL